MIEEKIPGQYVTLETRKESYEKLETKNLYSKILAIFKESNTPLSATDVAYKLFSKGEIKYPLRAIAHPRITELLQNGNLEVVGKKKCEISGRKIACYVLRNEKEN